MKKLILLSFTIFALSACTEVTEQLESAKKETEKVQETNEIQMQKTQELLKNIEIMDIKTEPVPIEAEIQILNNEKTTMKEPKKAINKTQTAVTMKTDHGDIEIVLYDDKTPKTVENFLGLAKENKYDDIIFHRIIENFMIQGGDYENQNGTGGQSIWGKGFENEIVSELSHIRGSLSMANAGPGTNGSQFFIVHAPEAAYLDGRHTVFGQVTDGMAVVDKIATVKTDMMDKPLKDVTILDIVIH